MTKKSPHQAIEQITDQAAYETLATQNPQLLAVIKTAMGEGATAKQLEAQVVHRFGRGHFIGLLVAGAAHHIERGLQ